MNSHKINNLKNHPIKNLFTHFSTPIRIFPLHNKALHTKPSLAALALACSILAALAAGWLHTERSAAACQASIANKILRLHVLANSDSPEDQALKLTVRDGILAYMDANAPEFDNVHEAKSWTSLHMEDLQKTAEKILLSQGCNDAVSLELTTCYFPVKTYGDLTFPAGDYEALRVKIGQAKGQNWWCVMYPPLCFTDATCCEFPQESREILERQLTETEYLSLRKGTLENTKNKELVESKEDMQNTGNMKNEETEEAKENTRTVKIKFKLLELLENH